MTRNQSPWCTLHIKFLTAALLKNVNSEFLMTNQNAKNTRHRFCNDYSGKFILNKPNLAVYFGHFLNSTNYLTCPTDDRKCTFPNSSRSTEIQLSLIDLSIFVLRPPQEYFIHIDISSLPVW